MVSAESDIVREIVTSEAYQQVVADLISEIKISVEADYEDVLVRLDAAKTQRAGLDEAPDIHGQHCRSIAKGRSFH